MTGRRRSRDERVTAELSDLGLRARLEVAGEEGELAVVQPAGETDRALVLGGLRERVIGICRRAGFRYVTLGLGTDPSPGPE